MACSKRTFFWESTIKDVKHNDSCWLGLFQNKTHPNSVSQKNGSVKWMVRSLQPTFPSLWLLPLRSHQWPLQQGNLTIHPRHGPPPSFFQFHNLHMSFIWSILLHWFLASISEAWQAYHPCHILPHVTSPPRVQRISTVGRFIGCKGELLGRSGMVDGPLADMF